MRTSRQNVQIIVKQNRYNHYENLPNLPSRLQYGNHNKLFLVSSKYGKE